MRLLFATTQSYLPQRVGGSQRSTHELSVALAARRLDVAVLCELDCPFDWTHIQNRALATITGRSYPCDRWRPYRTYRGVDAASGVREVARAFRPDVAIVHAGFGLPLATSFLDAAVRTVLYFRDVQFESIGGPIPHHANEYAEARMLLVPSVWEDAWGRVVTEAQLSGIPVLASAIGGLPESVGPGGILVPPGSSIDVWHGYLRRLWDSDDEYARYQRQAIDHSRRPDIDRDRLLSKFLDAVSGW